MSRWGFVTLAVACSVLGACTISDDADSDDAQADAGTQTVPAQPAPATPPQGDAGWPGESARDLRLEVDLDARELHVYRSDRRVATHPVAVGSEEWPTPTGEWRIGQVIFNPRWVPPDEEWAEDEEPKDPGDPENPLGRAQLVYSPPNSIHGTNEPGSLGRAVSHGSIRVANDVAVQLARQVMEAGGASRDERWFREAEQNRSERREVSIPNPVPIRVHGGGGTEAGGRSD